jgi:hypothetical protein
MNNVVVSTPENLRPVNDVIFKDRVKTYDKRFERVFHSINNDSGMR